MRFSGRKLEPDRQAVSIDHRMYLAGQATSGPAHGLPSVAGDASGVFTDNAQAKCSAAKATKATKQAVRSNSGISFRSPRTSPKDKTSHCMEISSISRCAIIIFSMDFVNDKALAAHLFVWLRWNRSDQVQTNERNKRVNERIVWGLLFGP
jgi:hypothetical protein